MPLRVIDDAVTSLKTRINLSDVSLEIDRRHGAYLKYCSPTQAITVISLVANFAAVPTVASRIKAGTSSIIGNTIERLAIKIDSPRLFPNADQELQKIKASMGTSFAQNQIKKGDPNFEYDLQKDFGPAVGKSDWDSSDSDEDSEKKPAEKQNVPISVPVATSISAESATAAKPIDARISPAAALNQNVGKDDEIDDEFSDQDIDDVLDALDFGDEDDNSRVKNSTKAAAAVTAKQSHSDAASALDT
eukprot:jgi/Hompol1/3139/HPOL_006359-RA